ncbi:response regulator transcription factor [Nocardioides sp. SOB44]|jgi:DNA-binding response OmpR family regulator|uniref:Response regulator transcription factor n=1 Tax=Nocardioides cremeus TaxID=3058044 RepID=A0ABT8TNP4_9ACTN|nr:response regulator transcription factor [Nocardioides cremeus]MDO3395574.1 response regulator transcription factor [Nocardioides cremeus]
MRVLVVDDDPDLSMLMQLVLSRQGGHDVDTAGDGLEALALLADSEYDVVVLDWNMPRLDGLGLCAAIRGDLQRHDLPLLMVTALPDHATARAAGIDQVLGKPFSTSALLGAVDGLAQPA